MRIAGSRIASSIANEANLPTVQCGAELWDQKREMRMEEKSDPDRRQPRLVLQLKTGVGQAGRAFDAEILNLSSNGMLVKTSAKLSLDEPIEVVLPQSGAVPAKVVWFADGLYGCRFEDAISEEEIGIATDRAGNAGDEENRYGVDHETLGSRIKRLRTNRGMTMLGLAKRVGVSKPTLWKWEGDQVRPRHETMQKLAEELDVSELELVYGAPGIGEAIALAEEDATSGSSLADIVRASRRRIADAAGVEETSVEILINWDSE